MSMMKLLASGRAVGVAACFFAFAWLAAPQAVWAYNPKSPKVVAMVQKARGFLQREKGYGLGTKCLIAMALVKSGDDDSHPQVQIAIKHCREAIKDAKKIGSPENYHLGVAILFLADTDNQKYRPEMEALLKILLSRQHGQGSWGYTSGAHSGTGDASMSQYATLACWAAIHAGIDVPQEAAERVFNFWLISQTPAGAWGYQYGPGHPGAPVRSSLAAAGLSSVFICGDMFGFGSKKKEDKSTPAALQEVSEKSQRIGFKPRTIDLARYRNAQTRGINWLEGSFKRGKYESGTWVIFYMYAMERYQSFRELAEGRTVQDPPWYNIGVDYLAKTQASNGTWTHHSGAAVETSLALLFLIRSTKKSIVRTFGEGFLSGARGLDELADTTNLRTKNGRIVKPALSGSVEDLLSILDNPNDPKMAQIAGNPDVLTAQIAEEENVEKKKSRLEQLKELVSTGDFQARKVAVRTLARAGSLENAPTLIYALSDPDPRVMLEARDGLRFISRKFEGFGMKSDASKQEIAGAIAKWQGWLQSISPEISLAE